MCRKLIVLIAGALVLGLACSAPAETYNWTNDAPDNNSWCDRFNWDPNTSVPGPDDTARLRNPQRGPIVGCDVDVAVIDGPSNDQVMDVISGTVSTTGNWDLQDGNSTINITGTSVVNIGGSILQKNGTVILNISGNPTITVGGQMKLADDGGDWCTMTMSGGSLTVVGRLAWEDNGGGVLNVSGGATIECGEFNYSGAGGDPWTLNLNGGTITVIGRFRAPEKAEGEDNVTMNLDAGILECGEFDNSGYAYAMDINEGVFIIDGNETVAMNADVNAGYITAFDGTVDVIVTYDEVSGKTIVRADFVQVKASDPSPDNYAQNECPGVELSWQAGAYCVDDHNVYFGTSMSDVNESASPFLDHYGSTQWIPSGLKLGTTYYWRVDEVNDTDGNSPWVGDTWQFTTNDGNAIDPYPEDTETAVPVDANLHWTPGCTADSHDVYFGTDYNDVRDANDLWPVDESVYKGNQVVGANEYDPCDFDYFTWYYWRIDEVDDGNTYKGKVLSFRSGSVITDPNRILWYKFDESQGLIASDSSGYEHHGVGHDIEGQWEPNNGHIAGCLDFDASEHVAVPSDTLETIDKEITVSVWVKGDDDHADEEGKVFDTGGGDYYMRARIPTEDGYLLWRAGNDTNDSLVWPQASPLAWAEDWHHFGFVKDENAGTMKIYFDGLLAKQKSGTINSLVNVKDKAFRIGADNNQTSDYTGKLDDFRIYKRALSATEIAGLFRGGDVGVAWGPSPYNGQIDVPYDVELIWRPGEWAADVNGHEVYLGTSFDDVNDANNTWPIGTTVYKGPQDANEYDPVSLEFDTTYYWRVDEVNDVRDPNGWRGRVWSFTTAEYIIIDNFEDDTAQDPPTYDWYNGIAIGTGAQISLRSTPPIIGEHSMRYGYANNFDWGAWHYYSETQTISLEPNDWDYYDVKFISLWFYGQSGNDATEDATQMNLGLEDDSNYGVVLYGGPGAPAGEDIDDVKVEEWQLWEIMTNRFTNINFSNVKKICIGFGTREWPMAAGGGTVYFDDIHLYPPGCRSDLNPLEGDFNGDCTVAWQDVEIMAGEWLETDVNLSPVQPPNDVNLVGWWKLDEPDSNIATDYAGYDNNGVIETLDDDVWWVAGHDGNALEFDGGRVRVPDAQSLRPLHQVSASAWIKFSGNQNSGRVVVKGADNKETFALEVDNDDRLGFYVGDGNSYDPCDDEYVRYSTSSDDLEQDEWTHIAGTYDGNTVKCYINGELVAENNDPNIGAIPFLSQDTNDLAIGNMCDNDRAPFEGIIDDVRVYNYGLSAEEIAYIATDETGIFTVQSVANLYNDEDLGDRAVNLRDFAKLANNWLKRKLWPE